VAIYRLQYRVWVIVMRCVYILYTAAYLEFKAML